MPGQILEYEDVGTLQTMLEYFSIKELDLFEKHKAQYLA